MEPRLGSSIKQYALSLGAAAALLIVIIWIIVGSDGATAAPSQQQATASATTSDAAREFTDVMDTAERAGLVSSYQFSGTERVIYVTDLWYQMSVTFKKDFLAEIGMLQQRISGRHAFEVHHEQSNEKVGEVTAFGGSLEVYK
jgi:hypothetical protein